MVVVIVMVALVLLALAYVSAPLRQPRDSEQPPVEWGEADELRAEKRAALAAILDLEEEAGVGKLTETEMEALRERYEDEALAALRQLDAVTHISTGDEDLEAEIASARERMTCPACGGLKLGDGPCPRCGA